MSTLAIDIDGHVARLTLDRPDKRNAVDEATREALKQRFAELANNAAVRVVILTGRGAAFCAGVDLGSTPTGLSDPNRPRLVDPLERFAKPIVAAINGPAYGGGLEMALACDFAYAVPEARFALTEVTLGIMPGAGGTQLLPRAVGERRAKEIILTGRPFGAQAALDWGILNRICPREELMPAALETAATICANAPLSIRQAKKAIHHGLQMDLKNGFMFEIEAYNRLVGTEDRNEGIRAFNEKRQPVFKGR